MSVTKLAGGAYPPPRLRTERLVLQPLRPAHAREMVGVLDDPVLYRYTGGDPPPLEDLEKRYAEQARGRSDDGSQLWFNWIVRDRASQEALGYVQATVEIGARCADIAWVIGSRHHSRGFAREAASAMIDWLSIRGVTAVTAHIHPGNKPSQAVARAIGFNPTSTIRDGEVRWKRADGGVCNATLANRVSALAPIEEERDVTLPGPDQPISYEANIKPLFREGDRSSMRFAFDLWSYDDVSANADAIWGRLDNGSMPCDGAWDRDRLDAFKRWMDTGKPA
jgi:RimJ/RimL family protein N-acetyltransferase